MMKRCWDSDILLRPSAIEFNRFCMLKLKQIHDGLFTDPELNTFASPPTLSSGFVNEMKSKLLCLNSQQTKDEYNNEFKDSKEINLTINSPDEDHINKKTCVNEHDKTINQLNDSSGHPGDTDDDYFAEIHDEIDADLSLDQDNDGNNNF